MTSQTNEQALESVIEKRLTGTCLEELKAQGIALITISERAELYRSGNGFYIGSPADFNIHFAIDERRLFDFLQLHKKRNLPNSKSRAIGNLRSPNASTG